MNGVPGGDLGAEEPVRGLVSDCIVICNTCVLM